MSGLSFFLFFEAFLFFWQESLLLELLLLLVESLLEEDCDDDDDEEDEDDEEELADDDLLLLRFRFFSSLPLLLDRLLSFVRVLDSLLSLKSTFPDMVMNVESARSGGQRCSSLRRGLF